MKKKLISLNLILLAVFAALLIGSRARAGAPAQYDIAYAIRVSGTGPMLLKYLGTSGSWQIINGSAVNGFVQTTGSGLAVNAGPQLSGSAAVASASGTNALPAGIAALTSSNTLCVSTGTAQGFH